MRCFASVFPGKCICIRNRRNGCVAFLFRKHAQDIKRRYWERFEPDYLTDEQKLANIEAYLQIEKDLGIKRGRPMTETGRYHIAWRWKRKRSGHIITAERLPDGNLRFYDPQNGMSGALDLYKKDIAGNIRIYRIDNLAPNANIVKDVLTKGETKSAAGTAAQGGISGNDLTRKQYKDKAVRAFENKATDVQMPNGTTAKQLIANGCTIGRRFFNETFAKNLHNKELPLVMRFASEVEKWIGKGQRIDKEKGRHHACNFKVYKVKYKGRTIIYKTMDLPDEPIYTMRLQK